MAINSYMKPSQIRAAARDTLRGHYVNAIWIFAGAEILTTTVTNLVFLAIPQGPLMYPVSFILSFILDIFFGIFEAGIILFYLKLCCNVPCGLDDLFWGFKNQLNKILGIQVVLSIISYIWMIPYYYFEATIGQDTSVPVMLMSFAVMALCTGVATLAKLPFLPCYYILHDFPSKSVKEILKYSTKLMTRNVFRLFTLKLSFLPLFVLGFCSCGVGLIWVVPYTYTAYTIFYLDLIKSKK